MVVVHLDLAMAMVKAICTLACTASAIPGHDRPWQLMRHVYCVHVPFECLFEISNSSFRKLSLELCPWIVEFYVLAARDTYAKHPSTSTRQTIAPDRREHARAPIPNAPGNSCAELMRQSGVIDPTKHPITSTKELYDKHLRQANARPS